MTAPASRFVRRASVPDDRRYVLTTWRRSEGEARGHIEGRLFGAWQDAAMAAILARSGAETRIVSPEGDDSIAGWAVLESGERETVSGRVVVSVPTLHYLFVRPECRRLGIARLLVGDLLGRDDVVYSARPPRILVNGSWSSPGWYPRKVPRGWRCLERAAFFPLTPET